MVAGAGRGQDRCGETAQRSRRSQAQRILRDSEDRREHRDRHQQTQGGGRIKQRMQSHRRKHRQVQHRDPGALQHQCVAVVTLAQPPAQRQQTQCRGRDPGVTQFDWHHHAFGGVTQQKRQTEKQQHPADTQHGVAAEQPVACSVDAALDKIRATGFGGLFGFGSDGVQTPDIVRQWLTGFAGDGGYWLKFGRQFPNQFGCRGVFDDVDRLTDRFNAWRWHRMRRRAFQQKKTLGNALQSHPHLFKLVLLLRHLRAKARHADRLTDRQPQQRTQQRITERLVEQPAEHQPDQHEHPLHGRYP